MRFSIFFSAIAITSAFAAPLEGDAAAVTAAAAAPTDDRAAMSTQMATVAGMVPGILFPSRCRLLWKTHTVRPPDELDRTVAEPAVGT